MTMKEFKKYLNNVIQEKETRYNLLKGKRFTKTYRTHLYLQIRELKDIRKVINS